MVISGFMMLSQSGTDLFTANNAFIDTDLKNKGLESKLRWQRAPFALEFTYDEGFEFEQVIPIAALNTFQQNWVPSNRKYADKIVIEVVRTFSSTTFEAYYFQNNILIYKLDFD